MPFLYNSLCDLCFLVLFSCILLQIWMLTGDKLETATCIAQSSRLVSRNQTIYTFKQVNLPAPA